ncbi:MAG: NnrS family protein [Leptospiraceae bacterium]
MTAPSFKNTIEPYRILFPVAWLGGLLTVGLWMIVSLSHSLSWGFAPYPASLHAYGVFALFVFPSVSGFLLTALPRFTGSPLPSLTFLGWVTATYLFSMASFLTGYPVLVCLFALVAMILTLGFARIRMRDSSTVLPSYLRAFLPTGLVAGLLGWLSIIVGLCLQNLDLSFTSDAHEPFILSGRSLLFYYSISLIVLGAGSRIAVTIQAQDHEDRHSWRRFLEENGTEPYLVLALLALGALIEIIGFSLGEDRSGSLVRSGAFLCFAAMFYWLVLRFRIYRNSFRRAISTGLWLSFWLILIGLGSRVITGSASVHWVHLFFVGGLALLIISVMTRVILSHGKWDLILENRSLMLWIPVLLLVLAAATRASAHLLPTSYINHLGYASFLFCLSVLMWLLRFLILTISKSAGDS